MPNVFNSLLRSPITKDGQYEWDPLISGYFFFQMLKLPAILANEDATLVTKQFLALCTAVTLPDVNITTVDRIGLGGVKTVVPTAIDTVNTFEFRFIDVIRDDSSAPLIQLIAKWSNSIRNHFAGVADRDTAFSMNQYKGRALFIATDPSISVCAFGIKLFGLMPTTLPYSGYTADVATNDIVEFSVTMSVDRVVMVDTTDSDVNSLLTYARTNIDSYKSSLPYTVG